MKKLLDSQAIEEVRDTSSLVCYNCLFLVGKPNGSFRPIIDLKRLNLFLDVPPFKMETLFSITAALQPQQWITKIDLKDAYHHILVHVNIHKYFCFVIAGKTYQFRVLPFGLSTAPREFTKTLAPLIQLFAPEGSESMLIWTIGSSRRIHQNRVFCIPDKPSNFYKFWDRLSIGRSLY